jgi:hypothetical protein
MNTFGFFITSLIFFIAKPMACWSYFANALVAYTFMIMAALSFLNYVESKMNER